MNSNDEIFKLPRLYTEYPLSNKGVIALTSGQAHYLHNVMRRKNGEYIRLFDGENGEWLGCLDGLTKKNGTAILHERLNPQPISKRRIHLIFTPIKKSRMDWLIEKAVELGATDFHPVLTQNTEVRKINETRLRTQIFEAAEQCERFEIPILHEVLKTDTLLDGWENQCPILSCLERYESAELLKHGQYCEQDIAFIIGPEGGFTSEEKKKIADKTTPVSLGDTILRCETAVIKALVLLNS